MVQGQDHYAKLLGIQKDVKYYDIRTGDIHPRHLVTCMALREQENASAKNVKRIMSR